MSFNKMKTDPELGKQVQAHLVSLGLQTPMIDNGLSIKQKITKIEKAVTSILETLGMDLTDDSLMETPLRVAKMYTSEIFWGLDPENFPKCTAVENKINYDQMVVETGITVQSNCEHHLVPIIGKATIAYMPNGTVLGLSKLNRIVEYFARRPQIQERLTVQIAEALKFILKTDDVAVHLDAEHMCVQTRGVEDSTSSTITTYMGGKFRSELGMRTEFLNSVKHIK